MSGPCKHCGSAGDVTCEECEAIEKRFALSREVKEALICDACGIANAYNCSSCLGENK